MPRIPVVAILVFALSSSGLLAQAPAIPFPAASPAATLKQKVGLTDITIVYSRPGIKGRKAFGGMAPYGEVWRTGANNATKITFSTEVRLNGNPIPAGTYALFTIPDKKVWTVIVSKKANQWGAFNYDSKDDLVRFEAKPRSLSEPVETFTIDFADIKDESALLELSWDTTLVPIKLEVDVATALVPKIEEVMSGSAEKKPFAQAATFYYDHNLDMNQALAWVNKALETKSPYAFELLCLKAKILVKLGDKEGALAAATESREGALKSPGADSFVVMDNDIITSLR